MLECKQHFECHQHQWGIAVVTSSNLRVNYCSCIASPSPSGSMWCPFLLEISAIALLLRNLIAAQMSSFLCMWFLCMPNHLSQQHLWTERMLNKAELYVKREVEICHGSSAGHEQQAAGKREMNICQLHQRSEELSECLFKCTQRAPTPLRHNLIVRHMANRSVTWFTLLHIDCVSPRPKQAQRLILHFSSPQQTLSIPDMRDSGGCKSPDWSSLHKSCNHWELLRCFATFNIRIEGLQNVAAQVQKTFQHFTSRGGDCNDQEHPKLGCNVLHLAADMCMPTERTCKRAGNKVEHFQRSRML